MYICMSQKYVLVCGWCVNILYLIKNQTYPKEKGHIMTSLNSLPFFVVVIWDQNLKRNYVFVKNSLLKKII